MPAPVSNLVTVNSDMRTLASEHKRPASLLPMDVLNTLCFSAGYEGAQEAAVEYRALAPPLWHQEDHTYLGVSSRKVLQRYLLK